MRKQIIAFCKDYKAPQNPNYDWFYHNSGDYFNDGKPIIMRFMDDDGDYTKFNPYYDGDNDLEMVWFAKEEDITNDDAIDHSYLTTRHQVAFLFDDGTVKSFVAPDQNKDIRDYFDEDTETPTGVYKEMVDFLLDYVKHGYYEEQELFAIEEDGFDDI